MKWGDALYRGIVVILLLWIVAFLGMGLRQRSNEFRYRRAMSHRITSDELESPPVKG